MAKVTKKYSFSKAEISKDDDGKYTLTETTKDNCETFDLSSLLDEMIGIDGISLSFGSEDAVPSI